MPSGGRKNEWILMVVEKGQERKNMLKAYSKEKKSMDLHILYSCTLLFLKFEDCSGLASL